MSDGSLFGGPRLDSWKAIADYLRRDVATVRRWEKTLGLPVRRVPGGRGRSVFAFTAEIDDWLKGHPASASGAAVAMPTPDIETANGEPATPGTEPNEPGAEGLGPSAAPMRVPAAGAARRWQYAAAAGAILIVAAVVAIVRFRAVKVDASALKLSVTPDGVVAMDARGQEVWRYPFAADYQTALSGASTPFQVVDGAVFVATSHRYRRSDQLVEGGRLLQFTMRGALQRSFMFDDRFTFGRGTFEGPWPITAFAIEPVSSRRRTAVAAHHYLWSPSAVAILDEQFRRLGTYVQDGWIEAVRWLARDRLLIAGFSQALDGGMVALLDPAALDAQGPEDPGSSSYCASCGAKRPIRTVVMPRSEINRATASRFNRAVVEILPDRIVAHTIEAPPDADRSEPAFAVYEFSKSLDLIRTSFSESYWMLHDALFAQGKLTHGSSVCPDRAGPREVKLWEAAGGWRTLRAR